MELKDKILVYGASGVRGNAVARRLLNEGYTVHTIVRNTKKAKQLNDAGITAFVGDLSNAGSLAPAHEGVNKVFLQLPVDFNIERIRKQIFNTVDAAKKANVELLVVNATFFVPDDISDVAAFQSTIDLISYVKESGIPFVILKPTIYMENLLIPGVVSRQTVAYPVPADQPIAWVSIEDAAAYGVSALTHPEFIGQTFPIVGPEAITGNQLAEKFSIALNQKIEFYPLSVEAFEEAITPLLGKETAEGLAGSYKWMTANINLMPDPNRINNEFFTSVSGTSLVEWIEQAKKDGLFAAVDQQQE